MRVSWLFLIIVAAAGCAPMEVGCGPERPLVYATPPPGTFTATTFHVKVGNTATTLAGATVAAEFFSAAGLPPMLGRAFVPGDAASADSHMAMLSYALWQRSFGGAPDIIGRRIEIDGHPATVVGVMPKGFEFPAGAQLWVVRVPGA